MGTGCLVVIVIGDATDEPEPDPRRWITLGILLIAVLIAGLDGTILNVAIPTILREFHTTLPSLQWVITGYSLTFAALLIISGRLGDIFGARRMFNSTVKPYAALGIGGMNVGVKKFVSFVLNVRPVVTPGGTTAFVPNDVLQSGDTFFTISYGGGAKFVRLWGPMGFFGDFRLRTLTNFFGNSNTWPELSAGLNFTWGEK